MMKLTATNFALNIDSEKKRRAGSETPDLDRKSKRTRSDERDAAAAKLQSFDDDKKTFREGDIVDILELLFTKDRDYLPRFNGPKVKADELAGKVVVLYFVSLSTVVRSEPFETAHLLDAYNAIQHKPGLEVVLVVVEDEVEDSDPPSIEKPIDPWFRKDPSWQFVGIFSRMPWAAIPYSDEASRERLRRKFDVHAPYDTPTSFIIDPAGCVLQCYCMDIFHNYGAEGFPFSHKRLASLCSQDNAAAEQLSLKRLLGSLKRDYVISNKEEHVPICNLEQKVVALYLYQYGLTEDVTEELKMAYKTLEDRSENFDVVLVNLYFTECSYELACEYTFWEAFTTMPWLALPFKSQNCRKVARIFNYPLLGIEAREYKPTLVIIGPNGSFVERLGAEILMKYGSEAYPFTLEGAAKAEGKRVENLKLDSLLDPKVVLKGGNSPSRDVPIFQLNGKRILLFIEANWVRSIKTTEFLNMLEKSYNDKKGKGDEFEVIHVSCRREEDLYRKCVAGWPWLVHPFSEDFSYEDKLISPLFEGFPTRDRSALVAFDLDGRLVTKAFQLEFDANEKNKEFPFAECLEIETLKEVTSAFKLYRPNPYEEDRDEDYGSYEDDEVSEDEDPSDQDEDDEESEDEDPSDQDEDDDDPYNI